MKFIKAEERLAKEAAKTEKLTAENKKLQAENQKLKADMDYLAMMSGVELEEDEQ